MAQKKSIKKNIAVTKQLAISLLVLAGIIFPTVIAVIYASHVGDGTVNAADIEHVILLDNNQNALFSEEKTRTSSHDSLIGIFNSIYENMTPSNANVSEDTLNPIFAEIHTKQQKLVLLCYFSFSAGCSYAMDASGTIYSIATKDAEKFLSSQYAETLYASAVPPVLTTADGDTIIPASVMWKYRNFEGDFLPVTLFKSTSMAETYGVAESISLSFSIPPDKCTAEVFNNGERIFSGNLNDLSYLTLDNISSVRVLCTGIWDERADRSFNGKISYDFQVTVHTRAEFFIDRTTLKAGEFALLKATNVSNATRLSFFSDQTDFSPTFMFNGNTAYAIIPYTVLENTDELHFTVSYGVSTKDFTISSFEDLSEFNSLLTSSTSSFDTGLNIKTAFSDRLFFISGGVLPNQDIFEKTNSFGISNGTSLSYYSEYSSNAEYGASCTAVMGGKVILVGSSEQLGEYAVIDVGLGVRIWYYKLSVVDVVVGEYVTTGDVIGKCGTVSVNGTDGFRLMALYDGAFLSPEFIVERSLIIQNS